MWKPQLSYPAVRLFLAFSGTNAAALRLALGEVAGNRSLLSRVDGEAVVVLDVDPGADVCANITGKGRDPARDIYPMFVSVKVGPCSEPNGSKYLRNLERETLLRQSL